MSVITESQLKVLLPTNKETTEWAALMNELLPKYDINTPARVAAFIAQCAHESAYFTVLKENLNYSQQGLRKVFPKYFPDDNTAFKYARQPAAIANRVYANRMGNGNEQSGDGWKFAGKGVIQLTGKNNHQAFANAVEMTLDDVILYLFTKKGALESACWFWKANGLNALADKKDLVAMTKRINGGTIGLDDRKSKYTKACQVLGV